MTGWIDSIILSSPRNKVIRLLLVSGKFSTTKVAKNKIWLNKRYCQNFYEKTAKHINEVVTVSS